MKSYCKTVYTEAIDAICPRTSCSYRWTCYRWRDYIQCPRCHANITIKPKATPRASYYRKERESKKVREGRGRPSNSLPNPEQTQPFTPQIKQSDDYD